MRTRQLRHARQTPPCTRVWHWLLRCSFVLFACAACMPAGAQEAHPATLLVGFHETTANAGKTLLHQKAGAQLLRRFKYIPVDVVAIPAPEMRAHVMEVYRKEKSVRSVELNYLRRPHVRPNDPLYGSQWHLENSGRPGATEDADIDAESAWEVARDADEVTVAVLDTGIDYTHPDLRPNLWENAAEAAGEPGVDDDGNGIVDDIYGATWTDGTGLPTNGDPVDSSGHGTHVAGIIGAAANNNLGGAGIAWSVQLMGLKFIGPTGGFDADAIAALEYALDFGVPIANNSWGGLAPQDNPTTVALRLAIEAAGEQGQIFICSSGNSSSIIDFPIAGELYAVPASFDSPNIISVASSTASDAISWFSNVGAQSVDLAAPGSEVLSTGLNGGYEIKSGTSMAAPQVAGVAALMLSLNPEATPRDLKEWLLLGVDTMDIWAGKTVTGGRLNAAKALPFAVPGRGNILFDNRRYNCEATARVTVRDQDVVGAASINVVISSSSGDTVELSLLPEKDLSPRFTAEIKMNAGAPVAGDAFLQVNDADVITALYSDADNGNNAADTVSTTAVIDCLPPVLSEPQLLTSSARQANFRIECSESALLTVRHGTDCGQLGAELVRPLEPGTNTFQVSDLAPNAPYALYLEAIDLSGNSGGGTCYEFITPSRRTYFLEQFSKDDFDLEARRIVFYPDGSGDYYSVCIEAAPAPLDLSGEALALNDDGFLPLPLPEGVELELFGVSYQNVFVGSNGYLTFGEGDTWIDAFFETPRIAALMADLRPDQGGAVRWRATPDAMVVSFEAVPDRQATGVHTFQIQAYFDGRIALNYGDTAGITGALVGLADGMQPDQANPRVDFSTFDACLDFSGALRLDRDQYSCTDTVGITVFDAERAGAGSVTVNATSNLGDLFLVALTESHWLPGQFVGALGLEEDSPDALPGAPLRVTHGGTFQIRYAATDLPAPLFANASVDCVTPFAEELALIGEAGTSARFRLAVSEPVQIIVRYGTLCSRLDSMHVVNAMPPLAEFQLDALDPQTNYFMRVEIQDAAGNRYELGSDEECFSFATPSFRSYYHENFSLDRSFDLRDVTLRFEPDGSSSGYSLCRERTTAFPVAPQAGILLNLEDDGFQKIDLTSGKRVLFFDKPYTSIYIGSNGYITFGAGDDWVANFFSHARVAGTFADLDPSSGGEVRYQQLVDRLVVTFNEVPLFGGARNTSFQIALHFDGLITISYPRPVTLQQAVAGLSDGLPPDANAQMADLSAFPECLVEDACAQTACLDFRHDVVQGSYTAGNFLDIGIEWESLAPNALSHIVFEQQLPEGWEFVEAVDVPETGAFIAPEPGARDLISFTLDAPPQQASFAYRVFVPQFAVGIQALQSTATYSMLRPIQFTTPPVRTLLMPGRDERNLRAIAQLLLVDFAAFDVDVSGALSLAEIWRVMPGLTAEEYSAFIGSGDLLTRAALVLATASGQFHTVDRNADNAVSINELIRLIQLFNVGDFSCDAKSEDGYHPAPGSTDCDRHAADLNLDWNISLSELLRIVQFFNSGAYHFCPNTTPLTEDGYCTGPE